MILTFSVFKEKIEDGTKTQTIRPYNERQFKRLCNAKKYQLYWHNPRNGGKLIKEVTPSEKPSLIRFSSIRHEMKEDVLKEIGLESDMDLYSICYYNGCGLTKDVHQKDGFDTLMDMFDWFYEKYGEKMYSDRFMLIRWMP